MEEIKLADIKDIDKLKNCDKYPGYIEHYNLIFFVFL
jgi:hypothetical protein